MDKHDYVLRRLMANIIILVILLIITVAIFVWADVAIQQKNDEINHLTTELNFYKSVAYSYHDKLQASIDLLNGCEQVLLDRFIASEENKHTDTSADVVEDSAKNESSLKSFDMSNVTVLIPLECSGRKITLSQTEYMWVAQMLYCEHRGACWEGQVLTCSAIINYCNAHGGYEHCLFDSNCFSPADFFTTVVPNQMQFDVLDYVINGGIIDNVIYFRADHYHDFGTPVCSCDNHYFSK